MTILNPAKEHATVQPSPEPFFNIRTRKVGGLRFVWIGRIVFSFCIRREV